MKARFFAIAALVLGLASCQKDFAPESNLGGEVDYRLSVSAPELAMTRAAVNGTNDNQNALDSAYGAIDYFQGAGWDSVDLRYTLEVYDADDKGNATSETPVKDRMVKVYDSYEQASFDLRLIQNRNYRFVVFADFVVNGAATNWTEAQKLTEDGLNHSFRNTLKEITIIKDNDKINNESADAYFAGRHIVPTNASKNEATIELTRPYAKVRVVATDLAELNNNSTPAKVQVQYYAPNAQVFNAVNGTISGTNIQKFERTYAESDKYTADYDAETKEFVTVSGVETRYTHKTLFTDYILAVDEQKPIQFDVTVFDQHDKPIKTTYFNTEIPVQRNHLTTIIGNVLTTATEIEVTINDNFANEAFVIDGEFTLTEDWNVNRSIIVEEGSKAVINLNGYSIINNSTSTELGIGDGIIVYGELEINGEGTIQGNTRAIWARGNTGAKVTVNGGNIVGAVAGNCEVVYASGNGQIEINGGTFEAVNPDEVSFAAPQYAVLNLHGNGKTGCDIKVKGGSFKNFDPSNNVSENPKYDFCAEGYGSFANGEWFEVFSMAIVHNADEFTAAAANAEIKAMRFANDINFGTSAAVVTTDKVILAEGHKLTAGGATTKNYGLRIDGDINVTVNDIVMKNCGGMYIINGAKVIVNNATMTPKYSSSGRNMFYVAAEGSELTVNSGEYRMGNTGIKYFAADGTAEKGYGKINVMGGKYYGTQAKDQATVYQPQGVNSVKIYGGEYYVYPSRAFDPTPWLADGYKTVEIEANWVKVVAE